MSQLSAADIQKRLLLIGNAAKARNPTGFVDEVKRRVGDGKPAPPPPPPEERLSWVVLEPSTRLERALAAGDAADARAARAEATATLARLARTGPLVDAVCRRLVRDGADVGAALFAGDGEPAVFARFNGCVVWLALAAPSAFAAAAARSRAFAAAAARGGLRQLCVAEVDAALKARGAFRPAAWRALAGDGDDNITAAGGDGEAARRDLRRGAESAELLAALERARPDALERAAEWSRADAVSRCAAAAAKYAALEESAAVAARAAAARVAELEDALAAAAAEARTRDARSKRGEGAPAAPRAGPDAPAAAAATPRGAVDAIRASRLVDVDLSGCPAAVASGARGLQRSLAAAAERLSVDLYEHRDHFLHELFQNADDARHDGVDAPALEVGLSGSWFFASSNQRPGFDAADVRAICDVNASTKAGDAATTGHKGIGFKAVFAMCDRPCVLSNGFAFYFDAARDGALGLVAPRWLELDGADGAPAPPGDVVDRWRAGRTTWTATRGPGASRVAVATAGAAAAYDVFGSSGATAAFRAGGPERPAFYHAVLPVAPLPASFGFSLSAPFDLVASRAALRATANNVALRAAVADAFAAAVASSDELRGRALDYLGSEDRAEPPFWAALRADVAARLADVACCRCDDGSLAAPAEVFRYPEAGSSLRAAVALLGPGARVRGRRLARVATAAAPRFALGDLVAWAGDADGDERAAAAASDAFWAALLDAEPELWPRIRKLRIVAADGGGPLRALADGLWAFDGPCFRGARGNGRVYRAAPGGGAARRRLLERLGVRAALSYADAVDFALDAAAADGGGGWETLDLLRRAWADDADLAARCLADGRASTLRVPAAAGRAAPAASLVSATLFGARVLLPDDVAGAISALLDGGGAAAAALPDERAISTTAAEPPPTAPAVEWEAHLDRLGVARAIADAAGPDVLVALGAALASAAWWRGLSPAALDYVADRLGDAATLAIARAAPARARKGGSDVLAVRDHFLRDAFAPLCGVALPYLFDDGGGADAYPGLGAAAARATRAVVATLARGDPADAGDALAALRVLAAAGGDARAAFASAAALYNRCGALADRRDDACVLVDGEKGGALRLALASNCVWDDDERLCALAGATRLAPRYAAHGCEAALARLGVEPRLGKARDFLATLATIGAGRADGEPGDLVAVAAACYARLAGLCASSAADRAAVANAFLAARLALVAGRRGQLVALRSTEAFWDVAPALRHGAAAAFALAAHHDAALRSFFVDVVGVAAALGEDALDAAAAAPPPAAAAAAAAPGGAPPPSVQQGFAPDDLRGGADAAPAATEDLAVAAIRAVQRGRAEALAVRGRPLDGVGGPPDDLAALAAVLRPLLAALAVPSRAVAVADVDRCPFVLDACLVLSRPRLAARSDAPYIVTEILHGLAHAIDDDHGDDHGAAAQALYAHALPRLIGGAAPPPPPPPMTLGPLPGARHAAAPRTHGGDARGRGRSGGGKGRGGKGRGKGRSAAPGAERAPRYS
ncbi:hypothetical protein AURANDRAFT_64375 [Aureococcus anophagefferens]|uniref:Protein NO VEIN C-terminal domain-containing protein n=1 Tax=Aureococcus anophagefferens TaxID=44056 RepID=F0Y9Y2_AURAN|nr:hypothetical protein AURANDRAFT_64375 [Aureococcus anophagefferens]EGB08096.1 hypothetical protein AURANDRAFT_64375 [Aureococcus anophagefferens]|eukprot:XP_009037454.1 hypothetical protein AURANDRAFT_64375 [Aureococcus anophagefferens]